MILLNDAPLPVTIFPDKTSQVWKLPPLIVPYRVEWRFEHEGEFMHLAQLRALLPGQASLYIPYLPYARQDKAISNETTFALIPFLKMLDALKFYTVTSFDVHNALAVHEHLRGFASIEPTAQIDNAIRACQAQAIVYPDEGAFRRYGHLHAWPDIRASKVREQSTGRITGVRVHGEFLGKRLLIVDDLCDGGMTFIKLADALRGAAAIHLYVSHGIFSKGLDVLRNSGIRRIFTKEGEVK